jgi:predicted Zn-dependent peptidase
MTLLLQENPSVDLVAGRIFLKNAGSRWEKREQAGLFNLLSRIITKGTEQYSALEIADKVESMGVSLSTDVTNDYFILSFKTVTSDFPEILELASEILHKPTFPESEIDLEKNLAIQSIRSQREQPFNVAYKELREAMYGLHPYALSILGQEETVRGLQGIDLKTTHQQHFRPDQLIISLSGNIELAKATSYVESIFGNWQNPATTLAELELATVPNQPQYKFIEQDTQQAVIMLGYFGASVYSQDYPVLKLLNTYLGNGLSSRLFVELREKRGLAYDVSAIYPTRIDLSQFILYIGTAPENTEIAKQGLQKEAERLVTTPLSQEELQSSKNKLLGQYALSKQTNAEVAQLNGWYETLGLGVEFDQEFNSLIQQITPELAQEVATKYLQQPYISLIGPVGLKNGG